jgi:hypothetical protein
VATDHERLVDLGEAGGKLLASERGEVRGRRSTVGEVRGRLEVDAFDAREMPLELLAAVLAAEARVDALAAARS